MSVNASRHADLRVLHVLTSASRRGAETFAADLHTEMLTQGIASRMVALEGAPVGGTSLPVRALGSAGVPMRSVVRALRAELRDSDVAVAHGSRTLAACALGTIGLRTPFVYRLIGEPTVWARRLDQRVRVAAALRRAAAVVAYHPGAAAEVRAYYWLTGAGKVHVIAKGIDLERFPEPTAGARQSARTALGLTDKPVVLVLGALAAEKDPLLALDAMRHVPEATLVFVGEGPERNAIEARAEATGLDVLLAGSCNDPRPWLLASDVVLLTSHTEGVPGVLLEAAASGTPAVATDVGGVAQAIAEGESGFIVHSRDPGDLARAVRACLERHAELGAAARRFSLQHASIEPVAQRWAELLRSIC